jgi:hypothetical protein
MQQSLFRSSVFAAGLLLISATPFVHANSNLADAQDVTPQVTWIELIPSARPQVRASIGGVEGVFILDTGASGGLILQSFADRLSGEYTGEEVMVGRPGGNQLPMQQYRVNEFDLGALALGTQEFVVMADDIFPMPEEIVGVLPISILQDYRIELDYGAWTLRVGENDRISNENWGELNSDSRIMNVDLEIGGQTMEAHLDSGNPGGIMLPIQYVETLDLADVLVETGQMRTVGSSIPRYAAPYTGEAHISGASITLENLNFADIPYANIGNAALGHLTLVLEAGGTRYAFLPSASPRDLAAPQMRRRRMAQPDE